MAAIEQVIRIATNRTGAASDVYSALASSTAISGITSTGNNIHVNHLPTGTGTNDLVQNGTGATEVVRAGAGPTAVVLAGSTNILRDGSANLPTLQAAIANTSSHFNLNGDNIDVTVAAVNLGSAHTFTNPAGRNAGFPFDGGTQTSAEIVWHRGDIAIVTETGNVTLGGGGFVDSGSVYSTFVTTTTFRIFNGWDIANNRAASDLGFAAGDTIRFTDNDGVTFRGSISGGTDFTVVSIAQFSTTNNALVTLNKGTFPADLNPAVSVGDKIFVSSTTMTTVPSGSYVFTADDQTTAAATTNDDWSLLRAPDGTATQDMLATFSADGAAASALGAITYNSTTETLIIDGTSISTGGGGGTSIDYNTYTSSETITTGTTALDIPILITDWAADTGSPALTAIDSTNNIAIYVAGQKLLKSEYALASNTITITIPAARRMELTENLTVTVELVITTIV